MNFKFPSLVLIWWLELPIICLLRVVLYNLSFFSILEWKHYLSLLSTMLALFMFSFVAVVQSLSQVKLFVTPYIGACQASLSFIISQSLLRLMSISCPDSVMPSSHLILCHSLLLLPSIFPSIRIFSNE